MNESVGAIDDLRCKHHPKRETRLRCSKCAEPICTSCIVQTPVGYRCRDCAQLRRLPQYSVGPALLARAVVGGLAVSALCWFLASFVPYLGFFLGIGVGVAVSEVMSRLSHRRSNRTLEVAAVCCVVAGMLCAYALQAARSGAHPGLAAGLGVAVVVQYPVPLIIASFVAVVRLR